MPASLDKKDLQRAVAHLQETLQQRMGGHKNPVGGGLSSEVKAVVHRGPEARTLDGQSIKQYESIKLNQYHTMGPYDTIKPSRLKRQSSGDNNLDQPHNLNTPAPPAAPPPPLPPSVTLTATSVATSTTSTTKPLIGPKPTMEKRDSFEGHEEAVRTIVEAVQESRKQLKKDG